MKKPEDRAPWIPAKYDLPDATAMKALEKGEANAHQQKMALRWIIETVAKTYDLSYRLNDRDTAFAEGKRFVGLQIVKLLNLPLSNLKS